MSTLEVADFVGVSTNVMTGIDIWEAARLTRNYGLTCMEIHLGDFETAVGDPWMIPHAGVWPRTCDRDCRARLRDELSHIRNLVIHGTPVDLNIAALNPGIREESRRQYREGLEFAIDMGATWMTYHQGRPSNSVVPPSYAEDCNVEFIESVLPRAREAGVKLAYESFNANLIERIEDPSFGILIDTGHAVMHGNRFAPLGRGDTKTITDWIDFLGERLIELHIHSVINWSEVPEKGVAHRSFEYGTCLDLDTIVRKLKDSGRLVPMISEIYEPTAEEAVATLARTRDRICACWNA